MYPTDTMEIRGYDAFRDEVVEFFEKFDVRDFQLEDVTYKVAGDVALGWGKWSVTLQGPEEAELKVDGRFSTMYTKHEDKWLVAFDHSSIPVP